MVVVSLMLCILSSSPQLALPTASGANDQTRRRSAPPARIAPTAIIELPSRTVILEQDMRSTGTHHYVLRARDKCRLSVLIKQDAPLTISLLGPDGAVIKDGSWEEEAVLPGRGLYVLEIKGVGRLHYMIFLDSRS